MIHEPPPGMRALEAMMAIEIPRKTTSEMRRYAVSLDSSADVSYLAAIIEREFEPLRKQADELAAALEAKTNDFTKIYDSACKLAKDIEDMRKALYEIIETDHHNHYDGPPPRFVSIARAALAAYRGAK